MLLLLAVTLPPRSLEEIGTFVEERTVQTDFGPVGPLALRTTEEGAHIWIQPYSGLPTRTDPRATLQAAQVLGERHIFAWDMAVAVNPLLVPGQAVLVTDYIDFTRHQPQTFLGGSQTGGISQSPAVCPGLTQALAEALPAAAGGVYLGIDGPRRETAAEARMFRQWGADILGQNLVPEIALARELGLCFAGLATVTETSAERIPVRPQGAVRAGLETVLGALPQFLKSATQAYACPCRG